jgi:hypothetical protein
MFWGWMRSTWGFGQLLLMGAFVLSAGLLQELQGPAVTSSPLLTELKAIETEVKAAPKVVIRLPAPVPLPTADPTSLMAKANQMSNIGDFLKLKIGKQAQKLIISMQSDEFAQGNPFYSLNNVYPVAMILDYGVKSFQRDAYRSHHFLGGMGYDVVKYQIEHSDGRFSYILAYKEKTGPDQIAIGQRDSRPTFSLFLVPQDQEHVFLNLYQDGKSVQNEVLVRDLAIRQVKAKIIEATPLLTARDPDAE